MRQKNTYKIRCSRDKDVGDIRRKMFNKQERTRPKHVGALSPQRAQIFPSSEKLIQININ